jgi:hypothetical protein
MQSPGPMSAETLLRAGDVHGEIRECLLQDVQDAKTNTLPSEVRDLMAEVRMMKEGKVLDYLMEMLDRINQFVLEENEKVVSRFLSCGYIRIADVMALCANKLAAHLDMARTHMCRCLQEMSWEMESSSDVQSKIASGEYFRDYPGFFRSVPRLDRFQFRTRTCPSVAIPWEIPIPMESETVTDTDEIDVMEPAKPGPSLKLKLANSARQNKNLKKEISQFKRKLSYVNRNMRIVLANKEDEDTVSPESEPQHAESLGKPRDILDELCRLVDVLPTQRRYSEKLVKFSFMLMVTSGLAYRILRSYGLPFPTVDTIKHHLGVELGAIKTCLQHPEGANLAALLSEYRVECKIPDDFIMPSTLAFDATSVSNTGIPTKKKLQSCFSSVLLPLFHRCPDLLVHSMPHGSGRIDEQVLGIKDKLVQILANCGFSPNFIASDGDNGIFFLHENAFNLYQNFPIDADLGDLVKHLTTDGPLMCWPISDFLHLLKNARTRIATGTLAFDAQTEHVITAKSLNEILQMGTCLEAHNPLDLLKDDLALKTFTVANLMKLWDKKELTGVYFFMPLVALSLAIRNDLLSRETRLGLIQTAFSIFFTMVKQYPQTGGAYGIYENSAKAGERKTLWTRVMCIRACNLCIGLYWAINEYPEGLGLGRIGTHSVECLFGTTRSMLRGDTQWSRFLGAQVDAIMVQKILREFNMQPYIRRFRNVSGCTLVADDSRLINIAFDGIPLKLELFRTLLRTVEDPSAVVSELGLADECIGWHFVNLCEELNAAGYAEKIVDGGPTRHYCIFNRLFTASPPKEECNVTQEELEATVEVIMARADE